MQLTPSPLHPSPLCLIEPLLVILIPTGLNSTRHKERMRIDRKKWMGNKASSRYFQPRLLKKRMCVSPGCRNNCLEAYWILYKKKKCFFLSKKISKLERDALL